MDIVCGSDFSGQARVAADVAAGLVRRLGGTLTLVHALDVPGLSIGAGDVMLFPAPVVDKEGWQRRADAALKEEAERLRAGGMRVGPVVEAGSPETVLIEAAERVRAGLIVVGTHGYRAPVRWLVGSTAERLVSLSPTPVLVVREKPEGLLAWTEGKGVLRALVAVDFDESSGAALRFARQLARHADVRIHIAHATDTPVSIAPWPPFVPVFPDTARPEVEKTAREGLVRHLEKIAPDLSPEGIEVVWGKAAAAITELAESADFDLILAGTNGRRGVDRALLGSVASGILRRSHVPVLIAPPWEVVRERAAELVKNAAPVLGGLEVT